MSCTKKIAIALIIVTALATTGVALAQLLFHLRGSGTLNGLNTEAIWSAAVTTSDPAGTMDPTGPGLAPTRASYDFSTATVSLNAGQIVLDVTGAYSGLWSTVHGQVGTVGDVVVAGITTDNPDVIPSLRLEDCGKSLAAAGPFDIVTAFEYVNVPSGGTVNFTYALDLVPSSDFIGSCPATF